MIRMNMLLDYNRPNDSWTAVDEDLRLSKDDLLINWATKIPYVGCTVISAKGCTVISAKFRLRCSNGIRARFVAISNVYECINKDITHV